MTPEAEAKLNELTRRMKGAAYKIAQTSPEHDPEDIFQEMALEFIRRANETPDFIYQKDAYIIVACAHNGGTRKARAARTYSRYVGPEPVTVDSEGEETSWFEMLPDHDAISPERYVEDLEQISAIADCIANLSDDNQRVVKLLYLGESQTEIANVMGVSKGRISQRKTEVRAALQPAYQYAYL